MMAAIPPVSTWGTEFHVVRHANHLADSRAEYVRVVAHEDDTSVTINGVTQTLAAGGNVAVPLFGNAGESTQILSTRPVLVAHFMNFGEYLDTSGIPFGGGTEMTIVTPTRQYLSSYLFAVPTGFNFNAVRVAIPTAALSSLRLNGALVSTLTATQIPGTTYSALHIPVTSGRHELTASQPFGAWVYGATAESSYGFPAGFGLAAQPAPVSVDLVPSTTPTPEVTPTPSATATSTEAESPSPSVTPPSVTDAGTASSGTTQPDVPATAAQTTAPSPTPSDAESPLSFPTPAPTSSLTPASPGSVSAGGVQVSTSDADLTGSALPPPASASNPVAGAPEAVTADPSGMPRDVVRVETARSSESPGDALVRDVGGPVAQTNPRVVALMRESISGFAAATVTLTGSQRRQISSAAKRIPRRAMVTCTGYSGAGPDAGALRLVGLARAQAVCAVVKRERPDVLMRLRYGGTRSGSSSASQTQHRKVVISVTER